MDFNEAAVFVKVVEAGSFSAAARQLGLPTSTVSTRVARLEKRLGITLLQRTTRRLHLTDTGQLYYQHASIGLGYLSEAETAVTALVAEPKGLLRVTAPADIGDQILANILSRSRRNFPQVNVDMVLRNRYVDLVAEGVDVAIRTGKLKDSTLVAKKIGIARWVPFASESYLKSAPSLNSPQALRHHNCLQFTPLGKETWTFNDGNATVTVPMSGKVMANDVGVIRAMALGGEGVALLPSYLCRSECEEGRLLRVLPKWHANVHEINIVYPRQRFMPLKLRMFVDIASQELRKLLEES
ncbi:LysR family transcriptional regulator [Pusillimonas sp. SM2304]|uniref:LysR family transcriptional regulator n=1 Tax=Pusillimonas sp. SM2304 TaxID=3073241 RepID=UPI002876ACE0|nr:LysR family transcriptional regulator [Pusillimonas sp. SM2304]MDS1139482.1 LysR family transcriptional regulator [Pusillimonas sp. SM2304]